MKGDAMDSDDITPEDRARAGAGGFGAMGWGWAIGLGVVAVLALVGAVASFAGGYDPDDSTWWLEPLLIGLLGVAAAAAAIAVAVRRARRRPGDEFKRPRLPALDATVLTATVQRVGETNFPIQDGYRSIPEIHVAVDGPEGPWDAVIGDLLDDPAAQGFSVGSVWKVNAFPTDRHWVALAPEHDRILRLGYWVPDLADAEEWHGAGIYAAGYPGPGSDIRFAAE